jgi:Virulence factor membrane-bound polymerase, C-terminal/O-Antigen ligase/Protein glycosylation ligase
MSLLHTPLPFASPPGPRYGPQHWLRTLAALALGVASVCALMGLLQYFGYAAYFSPWIQAATPGQAYANFGQRNHLATVLSMGLAVALFMPPTRWRWVGLQWLPWIVLPWLVVALAATGSRTGLAQLLALLGVLALAHGWRRPGAWGAGLLALVAYGLASWWLPVLAGLPEQTGAALARLDDAANGCQSRLVLWGNVLHLIAQKPWLGWGWGELDYAHFITLYPGTRFCDIVDNAHNLPLHLAVELGVPVALVACGLLGWVLWRAQPWRETQPERQTLWLVLGMVGLHSMVEYPLWYWPFQLAVFLSAALLWAGGSAVRVFRPPALYSFAPLAIVLIALGAYAAWDHWRVSQLYMPQAQRAAAYREDTLPKVQGSWLFRNQVAFAELTTTPLTRANAAHVHALALEVLHYSPEPRVIEPLIESATLLGQQQEAVYYLARYRAAFPAEHALWARGLRSTGER